MTLANPFVLPLLVVGLALIGTATFVVRSPGRTFVAREYVAVSAFTSVWALAYAGELASTSLERMMVFRPLTWFGVAFAPFGVILLALRYVRRPPSRLQVGLLAIVPVATVLFALTNAHHHLLVTAPRLVRYDGFAMRHQDAAPLFWVYAAYAYACVFGALIAYAATWIAGSPIYRRQARTLFVSTLVPLIGNLIFNMGASPVLELDLTPIAFGATSIAFGWALTRDGFLDLVPVAHDLVVASMDDPILVVDANDRVLDSNPAARALADVPVTTGIPFATAFASSGDLLRALRSGSVRDVRMRERDFELRTSELGPHEGRVVFLRDITERKRAEAEREAALETAEKAIRVRTEFMARMSHELRTPLHGIVGAIDLVRKTANDARLERFADAARISANGLLDLVNELLDFERLDAGVLEIVESDVDVAKLAQDVVASLRDAAEAKGLALTFEARDLSAGTLRTDPRRLRQVLVNLVGNAVKFTDVGSVHVCVASARSDDRHELLVRVEDTGPGVPTDAIESLFEPFVQLDGSSTRRADGSGLGLAICRRLADAMGAELVLANGPSGGAVASFRARLAEGVAQGSVDERRDALPSVVEARVLVADNHPVGRAVVTWMLEALGSDVVAVESGEAAIAASASSRFDLVLLDLHMPAMGGLEAAARLRASGTTAPILAFTADGRPNVRDECLDAGMDDVLLKPVDLSALRDVVARWTASRVASPRRDSRDASATRADIVHLYRGTYPAEIELLRRHLAANDLAAAREVVHGLAGASAMLGFDDVVAASRRILDASALHEVDVDRLARACDHAARVLDEPGSAEA